MLEKYSSIFLGWHFLVCSLGCPHCWRSCVHCNPPAVLKDSLDHSSLNRCWRSSLLCRQCCGWVPNVHFLVQIEFCKWSGVRQKGWLVLGGEQRWAGRSINILCMGSCVSAVMEGGSPLFGWQVKMSITLCPSTEPSFNVFMSLLFTHLLLLPDLLVCPVLKFLRLWF